MADNIRPLKLLVLAGSSFRRLPAYIRKPEPAPRSACSDCYAFKRKLDVTAQPSGAKPRIQTWFARSGQRIRENCKLHSLIR